MDIVIVLEKVLGLLLVTGGLGVLLNKQHAQKIVSALLLGSATSLTASVVTLLLGALIISVHNVWVLDGHVLLTLVGYVLFILGAVRFLVPDLDLGGKKSVDTNYLVLYGLIGLMVGIVFIYHGFFVG